jgi:hypothetical protein
MDINTFNDIIDYQSEISFGYAHKQIMKVKKICGFLNPVCYDPIETNVTPERHGNEIRLIQPNGTYSVYLKSNENGFIPYSSERKWFGEYSNYLVLNIGKGCAYVFEK